ncbi:MAG: lipase family protein [Isosphaeraceae bacterium]|nr:lipase family protein [Isosphaeraceae bacterium]
MTTALDVSAPASDANARLLAVACELAYLPEGQAQTGFRERLGLEAKLIQADNTQAYVAVSPEVIVVAFRGSESPATLDGIKDWLLTNANNFLILPEGRIGTDFAAAGVGARFHKGFLEALDEVWAPLYGAVDAEMKTAERPLFVTGHSLGGALALVAAWRFQQNFLAVTQVTTFGAPMVGNDLAAEAFKREFPGKISRYVDALDLVPLLPTVSLIANSYKHCLNEYVLEAAGGDTAADAVTAFASRASDGLLDLTLIDEIWSNVQSRIAHHMVDNYQSRLDERLARTS